MKTKNNNPNNNNFNKYLWNSQLLIKENRFKLKMKVHLHFIKIFRIKINKIKADKVVKCESQLRK